MVQMWRLLKYSTGLQIRTFYGPISSEDCALLVYLRDIFEGYENPIPISPQRLPNSTSLFVKATIGKAPGENSVDRLRHVGAPTCLFTTFELQTSTSPQPSSYHWKRVQDGDVIYNCMIGFQAVFFMLDF